MSDQQQQQGIFTPQRPVQDLLALGVGLTAIGLTALYALQKMGLLPGKVDY